jgi:DNA-binding transcriptional LysR family regulator
MEIQWLRTFHVITEQRSFSGAATVLGYSPSSVTAQIKQLEAELGVRLFERGRQFSLTTIGVEVLPYIERVLKATDQLGAVVPAIKSKLVGQVSVGIHGGAYLKQFGAMMTPLLANNTDLHLKLDAGTSEQLIHQVRTGQLDFAVCMADRAMEGLDFVPLTALHLVMVAAPDSEFATEDSIRLQGGLDNTLVLLPQEATSTGNALEKVIREHNQSVRFLRIPIGMNRDELIRGDMGVAFELHVQADKRVVGGLVYLPVVDAGEPRMLGIVSQRELALRAPVADAVVQQLISKNKG